MLLFSEKAELIDSDPYWWIEKKDYSRMTNECIIMINDKYVAIDSLIV